MGKLHIFFTILPLSILLLVSNSEAKRQREIPKLGTHPSDSILSGQQLAIKYCSNCHLFPEPNLLDKKTWSSGVLPNMGMRLGIREVGKSPYTGMAPEEVMILKNLGIYPDSPLISTQEWAAIIQYYEKEAPSVLQLQKPTVPILAQLPQFEALNLTFTKKKLPQTTLLKFDKVSSQLYIGDAQNELFVMDSAFRLAALFHTESAATDIDFPKNKSPRLLTIGSLKPSDQKSGHFAHLDTTIKTLHFNNLQRPVHFAAADFNKDGQQDVVMAQFGHNTGKLSWFESANPTKEHILKAFPGARRIEIADFNKDNKPDIMVLMAQAYEEVTIFYNQGKGVFKEKNVLKFPPVYGVIYFELMDFNKDGFQDILLTNGDNWDYSAIEKPYHGFRIYLNDGRDNFKEAFFYPYSGAGKAMARDFDNDGDLDIAVMSFYAELKQPEHSFQYLQNEGNFTFTAHSTPEAAAGKWLTMEVGDFDKDGDMDIVLGSYFHHFGEMTKLLFRGVESFPQLLVLKNQKNK